MPAEGDCRNECPRLATQFSKLSCCYAQHLPEIEATNWLLFDAPNTPVFRCVSSSIFDEIHAAPVSEILRRSCNTYQPSGCPISHLLCLSRVGFRSITGKSRRPGCAMCTKAVVPDFSPSKPLALPVDPQPDSPRPSTSVMVGAPRRSLPIALRDCAYLEP